MHTVKKTPVFDTYWKFAAKRQSIFHQRARGGAPPWSDDPILRQYKFTNAYRASDRVSQYLIRHVIYRGNQNPEEVVFRVLLFKMFNKIETWERLETAFGEISYESFSVRRYAEELERALTEGDRIYSAAYIMPTGGKSGKGKRKHLLHLNLIERMLHEELPFRLADTRRMAEGFDLLVQYPMIGDFLAYQFITDINYSEVLGFSEMDFVIPGPGARDGIRKCFSDFGGFSETELIKLVAEQQAEEFDRLDIDFQDLWGRPLQLIDCQSLFCETDKYARVAHPDVQGRSGRTKIKQHFTPAGEPLRLWYPPKWGINDRLPGGQEDVQSV